MKKVKKLILLPMMIAMVLTLSGCSCFCTDMIGTVNNVCTGLGKGCIWFAVAPIAFLLIFGIIGAARKAKARSDASVEKHNTKLRRRSAKGSSVSSGSDYVERNRMNKFDD